MQKPELYKKTVDILVDAYFKDTLVHGNCYACAAGNIVAANMGYVYKILSCITPSWVDTDPCWKKVFVTDENSGKQFISPEEYVTEAKEQIDSTGYSWQELARIEYAFETAPKGKSEDEYMFNGLMAVIDVMDKIHENKDTAVNSTSKARFNKTVAA